MAPTRESPGRALAFDDAEWESGRAELGYGDGGEATLVDFGPEANNKYVTTYFQHAFQEIFRNSMPFGIRNFRTYASTTTEGTGFLVSNVPPASLQPEWTVGNRIQVLRSFATQIGDARSPEAGLMRGSDGALYGTTTTGGKEGLGTINSVELAAGSGCDSI